MRFEQTAIFLIAVSLVMSMPAGAAPFTSTTIRTTCPSPGTTAGYSNSSMVCETGNSDAWLVFSGFSGSPSAMNMKIQALANGANQGFYFPDNQTGPLSFQVGLNIQSVNELIGGITFHVTASGFLHDQANVTMYVCPDQNTGCDSTNGLSLTLGSQSSLPSQTLYFNPTQTLSVSFTGNVDPQALLTQFEGTVVTTIPEPRNLSLVACGLAGLLLTRKRIAAGIPLSK